MNSELQDAVTLAMDLNRTQLQIAAKRVYEELVSAEAYAMDLPEHLDCDLSADRLRRFNAALETAFDAIALLMHEGDCE